MARTTPALVAGIIEVDNAIDLAPFIAAAGSLVDVVEEKSDHTAELLELIERWLSAHFYTVRDPRAVSEKAGPVGVTYQSKVDLNLSTSHYGQTAIVLDTSGTLKRLSKGVRSAVVAWLGKELE